MAVADPRTAIAGYLLDTIGALVDGHVFAPKLPEDDDMPDDLIMPQACIIVSGAGGASIHGGSFLPLGTPRIDVRAYGSTGLEADTVAQACQNALKQLRPCVYEGVKLHSANISAEPNPLVDPTTLWPFTLVSVQVMYVECN